MIAEAYILFLAFQDKLLSEGHYYIFLKEEQRKPSKCFTTLSWGGGTGNSLFQGFPRAFLGLEQASSPHVGPQEGRAAGSWSIGIGEQSQVRSVADFRDTAWGGMSEEIVVGKACGGNPGSHGGNVILPSHA